MPILSLEPWFEALKGTQREVEAGWQVLVDALLDRGDPWAEVLAMRAAGASVNEIDDWVRRVGTALLGARSQWGVRLRWEGPVLTGLSLEPQAPEALGAVLSHPALSALRELSVTASMLPGDALVWSPRLEHVHLRETWRADTRASMHVLAQATGLRSVSLQSVDERAALEGVLGLRGLEAAEVQVVTANGLDGLMAHREGLRRLGARLTLAISGSTWFGLGPLKRHLPRAKVVEAQVSEDADTMRPPSVSATPKLEPVTGGARQQNELWWCAACGSSDVRLSGRASKHWEAGQLRQGNSREWELECRRCQLFTHFYFSWES